MVWNVRSINETIGTRRKIVGLAGSTVVGGIVNREALLLELITDE